MEEAMDINSGKLIHVKYGPHFRIAGSKFLEVIKFINSHGYYAYECKAGEFSKLTPENFVEDYRKAAFVISKNEIDSCYYTQFWNIDFINNTKNLGKFDLVLEIGSFEGLTTNYICDNLLTPTGKMIAVDPLEDSYLESINKEVNTLFVGQYDRFIKNTKNQPVQLIRKESKEAFAYIKNHQFDFIYVDGDHSKDGVYFDAEESFKLCKKNGYILFDDYKWSMETQEGIDNFLIEHSNQLTILIKNHQVLIQKM